MLFYRNFYDFRLLKFTYINQYQQTSLPNFFLLDRLFSRESAGARTRDPNIKSVVLYLLSYGFIVPNRIISIFGGANV